MKYLYLSTVFVVIYFCSLHLQAQANIEFLFDGDGNTGTTAITSSLSGNVSSGNLVYDENNSPSSGTIDLQSTLTSGQHILEIVLSAHDLSGFDANAGTLPVPFEFKTGFSITDGINNAEIGLKSQWYIPAPYASIPILYSSGSQATSKSISRIGIEEGSGSTLSSLYSDLTMGVSPITLQINADLDSGTWTSRVKYGSGDWINLIEDGSGISSISQIGVSSTNSLYPWTGSSVSVDSITLREVVAQSTSDILIGSSAWGSASDLNVAATGTEELIGNADQVLEDDGEDLTLQIIADLDSGDWASRYQLGSGQWQALVTDGTGLSDLNVFALKTETSTTEAWGDSTVIAPNTGDYIKIDSIRILPGSNFDKASASVDIGSVSSALLAFEFNGAAGEDIKAKDDGTTTATTSTGIVTGAFSNSGYLTDGNNLNIGYAGENSWTTQINGDQSYRTFSFNSPLTTELAGSNIVVFEVVIPSYDLSKSWDSTNTVGSLSGKGLQFSLRNSNNAGAAINLFAHNKIAPNSVLQIDFDEAAGTTLPDLSIISALNYTGSWEFGGPQTDGEGNLNIGYSGLNRWADIYGSDDSGSVYRTFVIDADPDQENNQAIESGRYIFETRIDAADLSGSWKSGDHLVTNKGMQVILRKRDNSGAVLNFYSHLGENGYQIKAQSNTWIGAGTTSSSGFTQAFGLSSSGAIDLQIRVNLDTGQWTTRAKSTSSSTWKDMELNGEGLTDIASIQIGVKTPVNDNGTSEDTSDDTLYLWGDDTLNGNAPEDFVDANDNGNFDAGVLSQSTSNSDLFSDSGDSSYPYAYTVVEPVIAELPQDASLAVSKTSNGNSIQFTWSGSGVTVESSEDLETWTPVSNPSSQILESLGLVSAKFYRLTMASSSGESSASEQNIVINVSELPEGGANYRIITTDANGNNTVQSNPSPLSLGENTISVPSSSTERNVLLWMDGDVTFTSLNKNGEEAFTAVPGESFTDTNGNGVRDPGNAPLLGDYIKINYLRITEDTSADTNNSIVVSGKVQGAVTGTPVLNVPIDNSNSLSGINLKIKISANLSSGNWSSEFSPDNGTSWIPLVTDGEGLTTISNFTLATKTPQYDAWGDGGATGQASDDTPAPGNAGDFVKIDSIVITDKTDVNSPVELINFVYDDAPNGWAMIPPSGNNSTNVAQNSGTVLGTWSNGGPRSQAGNMNIGYTPHWRWAITPGQGSKNFRKYNLDNPITSADATSVEMVVTIPEYSLSGEWDTASQFSPGGSLSGKGMIFRLDSSSSDYATVEFETSNAADSAIISNNDADGDGIPTWADDYPNDNTNGQAVTGVYVNQSFDDIAPNHSLALTNDTGTHATNWNHGGPTAQDGNLVIGFPGSNGWAGMIGGVQGWRKKYLTSDVTGGVVVLEAVISEYNLSKSWSSSNSSAEKGWRIVLTNGDTPGNQQGPIIALYTDDNGGTEVYGSTFYGGERVVFSEGDVRKDLGNSSQASTENLTLQIVCDLDSGLWYSRYKVGNNSWNSVNQYGAGFYNIDNIRISHKNANGDDWGVDANIAGDYVLIDSIKLGDLDKIDSSIPLPSSVVPSTYANLDAATLGTYDTDEDGRLDAHEEYPNDADNDGSPTGQDADDTDPDVQ